MDHVGLGVGLEVLGTAGVAGVTVDPVDVGHALFGVIGAVFSGAAVVPGAACPDEDGGIWALEVAVASDFFSAAGAYVVVLWGTTGTACRLRRLLDPEAGEPVVDIGVCDAFPLPGGMTCTRRAGAVVLCGVVCDVLAGLVWK